MDVVVSQKGAVGLIELNRASKLNALSLPMLQQIHAALEAFEPNPLIRTIVLCSRLEKIFCAGGDIRWLFDLGKAGNFDEMLSYWTFEYHLNRRIRACSKPYVALVDGTVMGGGVGISLHGGYIVAGDRFSFSMPETTIGFFPDIGSSFFFPRLKAHMGYRMALLSEAINGEQAVALGLARAHLRSADFAPALRVLIAGESIDAVLSRFARTDTAPELPDASHFNGKTIAAVVQVLEQKALAGEARAIEDLSVLRSKSPLALAVTLEQMLRGASMDFETAQNMEFSLVQKFIHGRDFYEGVRAQIIEKDRQPKWSPHCIEVLDQAVVDGYFEWNSLLSLENAD